MLSEGTLIAPIFVIVILVITFVAIYKNWVLPVKGMFLAVLLFLFTGIISIDNILDGLANPAIPTILLLIIVASIFNNQFNLSGIFNWLIVHNRGYKPFMATMMMATSILSSFMNNTAVVALMSNYVYEWGEDNGISPSKLMMPLSFAAIIGGMITVIGTSTTLILIGFMEDYGAGQLDWWKLLLLGSYLSLGAIVYFLIWGHRWLPNNEELIRNLKRNPREYLAELEIGEGSELAGKTLSNGKLRNLKDFYLVEIIRGTTIISPVAPGEILQVGDRLFFAGETKNIQSLLRMDPKLNIPGGYGEDTRLSISEVVISYNSSLIGRTIKHSRFRQRYDSAVLAVHRNGEKIRGKIGSVTLRAGDVLLLSSGDDFQEKVDLYRDIYVISNKPVTKNMTRQQRWIFFTLSAIALVLLVTQLLPLLTSLLIIFGVMVLFNLVNLRTIKRELDVNLGAILVLSLAMGHAITESGAAHLIADQITYLSYSLSPFMLMVIMILLTALLTTFITNVAAVSIAFPIGYDLVNTYPALGMEMYLGIAFAASAAFLTPISYQTNLIVAGPGGYTFRDFAKTGSPLFILYIGTLILTLYLF